MMTTTHILMGAAISSRPKFKPYQIVLAWVGGFVPDASLFLLVIYSRIVDVSGGRIWANPNGLYWQEPWQFFSAVSNSIPMWSVLCLAGYYLFRKKASLKGFGLGVLIFSSAAWMHVVVDFATHARDSHVHFWPFTSWRFHSPISYYDPAFHGNIVGLFEAAMGLGMVVFLVLSFKNKPVRIFSILLGLPYLLSVWFILSGRFS